MTAGRGSSPTEAAMEVALVKLHGTARPSDRSRVEARLSAWAATTLITAEWGWIVRLPEPAKAMLRTDRAIALVGGIQPSARPIPRIRVPITGV